MTLQQYIDQLGALVKESPEALEYLVITSGDDEGNSFTPVHYSPAVGEFRDREFTPGDTRNSNAVCLN